MIIKKHIVYTSILFLFACSSGSKEDDKDTVRYENEFTGQFSVVDSTPQYDPIGIVGECNTRVESRYVFILLPSDLQIKNEKYIAQVLPGDTVCTFYSGEFIKSVIIEVNSPLSLDERDSQMLAQIKDEGSFLIGRKIQSTKILLEHVRTCSSYEYKMGIFIGFRLVVENSNLSDWDLGCYNDLNVDYSEPYITEYYRYGDQEYFCKMLYAPEHKVESVFLKGDTSEIFQFYYP